MPDLDPGGTPSRAGIQQAIDDAVADAMGDTGWVALSHAGTAGTMRYRKLAGWVCVECSITIASLADAAAAVILTTANALPSGSRPSLALNMGIARLNAGTQAGIVTSAADGSITITNRSGAAVTSVQFRYSYPAG